MIKIVNNIKIVIYYYNEMIMILKTDNKYEFGWKSFFKTVADYLPTNDQYYKIILKIFINSNHCEE